MEGEKIGSLSRISMTDFNSSSGNSLWSLTETTMPTRSCCLPNGTRTRHPALATPPSGSR
ncbi:Uncharacterised protein [Salmonella enterica subsp. enterica serovar Typhi]|nr:Uncharacterised protein [Salmonella enterica subsp. enterica serovar Typhi]